jgi:glutaredoxin-related protein|tara:strand:+ start:292 stop:594 length:303 start_codon:yes stop_codon:yes gene_type:complete
MKDKRTYDKLKEHGEDMTHENETKIDAVTALTNQYRSDLKQYQDRESLHLMVENQLKGTKEIIIEMSSTIKKLQTNNNILLKENDRLAEEIQLLEMQIKK